VNESVLGAVLGLCGIGQDGDERPEYPRVCHAIEAVEVVPRAWFVGLGGLLRIDRWLAV
jgi:hypothetical protein